MSTFAITRILRLLRTRTGRWILAIVFGLSCLAGLGHCIFTPSPPEPPPNTLTFTFTWDEWNDIQNCLWWAHGHISSTLNAASDTLPVTTIERASTTADRLWTLGGKLIDDAEAQTTHIPEDQIRVTLAPQLQRSQDFTELMVTIEAARIDLLFPTPQPSGPGPKKP